MNNPILSGAAESAAPAAALSTSSTPTPGVQETPGAPAVDLQLARSGQDTSPTVVSAKPVLPLAALPKTIGLPDRQRLALQALAAGNSVEDAARFAGVSLSTLFRWRKHHPRFIAAWNAWQAESQRTARGLLAAANEHAARTILRAAQNGDVRASLAVLKGLGTLARQEAGPELARAVATKLAIEADKIKLSLGSKTSEMKRAAALKKLEEKQVAAAAAKKAADLAAHWKQYFEVYPQIPPLPRPITVEAVQESVKASQRLVVTYPQRCSFTITAVTGGLTPLATYIAGHDVTTVEEAERRLNSLPLRLNGIALWNASETIAQKLESLGATVELRPGWRG